MDTGTGMFVDTALAPKGANKYRVSQMVSLDGDSYEVVDIRNVSGRGQITLRGTSSYDREQRLAERDPVNRAERRARDRKKRLERKRRKHSR